MHDSKQLISVALILPLFPAILQVCSQRVCCLSSGSCPTQTKSPIGLGVVTRGSAGYTLGFPQHELLAANRRHSAKSLPSQLSSSVGRNLVKSRQLAQASSIQS